MINKLVFIFAVIAILSVLAFKIYFSSSDWNDEAYNALLDGNEAKARALYKMAMQDGHLLAANNLHVLDYRAAREETKDSRRARNNVNRKYRAIFDELSEQNLAVGTYNRALFEFRCAVRQPCYATGKARFQKAHEQGDALAKAAFAQTLSYTEPAGDPDRRPLLRQAADDGNVHAAFTYSKIVFGTDRLLGKIYAEMAVQSGNSHAQNHLALFFKGDEQKKWLEKAATNPKLPRRQAAKLLGHNFLTGANGFKEDFEMARHWFEQAVTINSALKHPLVIRRDGLRWRDIGTGFNSGKLSPGFAAYDLAVMNYCGLGGPQDFASFEHNMKIASEKKIYNSQDIIKHLRNPVSNKSKAVSSLISTQMKKRSYDIRPVFETCLS